MTGTEATTDAVVGAHRAGSPGSTGRTGAPEVDRNEAARRGRQAVRALAVLLVATSFAPGALAYDYQKSITINRSQISDASCGATLTNYPLLFSVTDPDLAHTTFGGRVTDLGGDDIIFRGVDATTCGGPAPCVLDHQIETYVNTTGELVAWVRLPSVNTAMAASNTTIYIHYGDTSVTTPTENPTGVWDASYQGVWHLNEGDSTAAGFYKDSTSNAEHGTLTDANGNSAAAAGQIGGAYDFNGDADQINVANFSQYLTTAMTISGWVNPPAPHADHDGYFGIRNGDVDHSFYVLQLANTTDLEFRFRNSLGPSFTPPAPAAVTPGTWAYIALTYDGANVTTYVDGQFVSQITSASGVFASAAFPFTMGAVGGNPLDGTLDEVRVSDSARSACWIDAEYDNQFDPGDIGSPGFYTVGATTQGYDYFKPITIDRAMISSGTCGATLTDFPMLFSSTDADLAHTTFGGDVTDLGGDDIVFRALDDTTCGGVGLAPCTLDHEIQSYANNTGQLVAWVRLPSVNTNAAASDTQSYVFYGNDTVTSPTENPSGVWDSSFGGVWHMEEATGATALDSTSNANGAVPNSGNPTSGTGFLGSALTFFSTSRLIIPFDASLELNSGITPNWTMSAWVRPTSYGTAWPTIYAYGSFRASMGLSGTAETPVGRVENWTNDVTVRHTTGTVPLNEWHYVTVTRTATSTSLYIDGALDNTQGATNSTLTGQVSGIGADGNGAMDATEQFRGQIDEVRVSRTNRSTCWVGAEYNNQVWPDKSESAAGPPPASPSDGFYGIGLAAATAVELVSFTATGRDGAVALAWETASEIDNLGFHVYRSTSEAGPWEPVTTALIPGLGSSPSGARYGWVDSAVVNGQAYWYLLEDVETTGARKQHGPVLAIPTPGVGGDDETDDDDPTSEAASWIRYGNPEATALRVVSRGRHHAVLELTTGGFYALPQEDGSVALRVPSFDPLDSPGAPDVPVRRTWLEAIAGQRVEIGEVRVRDVESFASLRPADAGVPEAWVDPDGTIRAGRRAAKTRFRGAGLFPEKPAALLEVGFQGELKKALVELAPLRWDAVSGQLLLARRLEVTVSFRGREAGERGLGGGRGRKGREGGWHGRGESGGRGRPTDEARVVAYLSAPGAGLSAASFEEVLPGQRRALSTTSLRLSRRGEDVPFHVTPDPRRFGPGSTLHFVSTGAADNPDTPAAVYALEAGVAGTRMAVSDSRPAGATLVSGQVRRVFETDRLYMSALLEAPDPWLWDIVVAPRSKSFPFSLERVVSGAAGRLQLALMGATDTVEEPDHHVRVSVNGVLVADVTWDGKRPYDADAQIPPGVLVEGVNSLEIQAVGDTGASISAVWLDRFAIEYSRALFGDTGSLEASFDASGQAQFSGLGSLALFLDVSDPAAPVWLSGAQWTGTALALRAEAGQRVLAVSTPAEARAGVRLAGSVGALRDTSTSYDYVAIGPREFLEAAAPLLQWRRDQGLRVLEAPVEDVYDAFSGGEVDTAAIRDFLGFAFHQWPAPPRYALLLGDASYDGKGRLGYPDRNRVPPFMVRTPYMWTVSDAAYAAVNGDDELADIAIGRLPASDVEEARVLALKVLARERDGYRFDDATAVLVADNPDHAGDFSRDVEAVAATVLAGRDVQVLRLDQLGGGTRGAIRNAFDSGAGIVSYFGHGAIALWASENVFNNNDVATLAPQPQQPLLLTMNCLNGYILHPLVDSLAEKFLKAEGKGAVAAFSPSSLSVNQSARRYHDALLDEVLSGRHERLGDAVLAAQARYADEGALPDLLASYLLLADPATRLH